MIMQNEFRFYAKIFANLYMMIDYITNVKKGKIDGQSHNRWEIIGLN